MAGALGLLAGLGQAAGGLPQGLHEADLMQQRQTALDRQQAALEQQNRQFEESRWADVPTAALPSDYRAQAGTAPTMRVPAMLVPHVTGLGREERQQEMGQRSGAAIASALEGSPEFGPLAKAATLGVGDKGLAILENIIKFKTQREQQDFDRQFMAAMASQDPQKMAEVLAAKPPPPTAIPLPPPTASGTPRILPTGGLPPEPNPAVSIAEPPSMQIAAGLAGAANAAPTTAPQRQGMPGYRPPTFRYGRQGGSIELAPEPPQYEIARRALADKGWQPSMKGYDSAFFDMISALTPYTEGGGVTTRSFSAPSPPGAGIAQVPGGPRPLPGGGFQAPPKPPEAGERKDIAKTDTVIRNLTGLIQMAQDPEIKAVSGSVLQNPLGALKQKSAQLPEFVRPKALTPIQSEYNARLTETLVTIRNILFGVRVTAPELAALAPAMPQGPMDPYMVPKLQAWQKFMSEHRADIDNALAGSNRAVIAPRGAGAPGITAPVGKVQRWGRDAQGNPVPLP